jgi:hypothetical protein
MILIGGNVKRAMTQLEVRPGPDDYPMAVKTPLGWTIVGAAVANEFDKASVVGDHVGVNHEKVGVVRLSDEQLHAQVENFWCTESFGCTHAYDKPQSIEDIKALGMLDKTVRKLEDNHYELGMLWSDEPVSLTDNREMAEKRFHYLSKKLARNPDMRQRYTKEIHGYISNGYARKLTADETVSVTDRTYYLPHHGVTNPKKPGKLRVVFDAAAQHHGHSLNSKLLSGPDLANNLVGILMRFRRGVIAMSADVEGMFHQVHVPECDSDALRFLWKDDLDSNRPPDTYKMCVHIFGAKCSPCCANYCLKRDALDAVDVSDLACQSVLREFYVDDFMRSVNVIPQAVSLALELVKLTATGGFKLTKWASNCQEVLDAVSSHDPTLLGSLKLDLEGNFVTRTLGISCNLTDDIFIFEALLLEHPLTKRGVLSALSSVYDPLGFISPYILRAKMLLQNLWEMGLDWDELIPNSVRCAWLDWLAELPELVYFSLRRCYWPAEFITSAMVYNLHIFCDASEKAFGTVSYLQVISGRGERHSVIIMSKTRVAPVDKHRLTLPRLELQAAVLATRMYLTIQSEIDLSINEVHFWTDSTVVIHYIRSESKRFKFVANRIAEIRQVTEPDQWKHVPSELNPADDCSRGLPVSVIKPGHRWLDGPEFLRCDKSEWPSQSVLDSSCSSEHIKEVACEVKRIAAVSVASDTQILDPEAFSSMFRLTRVTAWCIRFIHNCVHRRSPSEQRKGRFLVREMNDALMHWVRVAQHELFAKEINCLMAGKPLPSESSVASL